METTNTKGRKKRLGTRVSPLNFGIAGKVESHRQGEWWQPYPPSLFSQLSGDRIIEVQARHLGACHSLGQITLTLLSHS